AHVPCDHAIVVERLELRAPHLESGGEGMRQQDGLAVMGAVFLIVDLDAVQPRFRHFLASLLRCRWRRAFSAYGRVRRLLTQFAGQLLARLSGRSRMFRDASNPTMDSMEDQIHGR